MVKSWFWRLIVGDLGLFLVFWGISFYNRDGNSICFIGGFTVYMSEFVWSVSILLGIEGYLVDVSFLYDVDFLR